MNNKKLSRLFAVTFSCVLLFLGDIILKKLLLLYLPKEGIIFFHGLYGGVGIIVEKNYYIAMNFPLPYGVIIVLITLLLCFVLVLLNRFFLLYSESRKKVLLGIFGLQLIFFGGLGNLVDRLIYGYVVDYICLCIWPIFNLSDIMVAAGTGILIVRHLQLRKKFITK